MRVSGELNFKNIWSNWCWIKRLDQPRPRASKISTIRYALLLLSLSKLYSTSSFNIARPMMKTTLFKRLSIWRRLSKSVWMTTEAILIASTISLLRVPCLIILFNKLSMHLATNLIPTFPTLSKFSIHSVKWTTSTLKSSN